MGYLIEGVLEQDPMTDKFIIRSTDAQGRSVTFDPLAAFSKYRGQEVRFTLISFENLNRLAKMVEDQGGGQVFGIHPGDVIPKLD